MKITMLSALRLATSLLLACFILTATAQEDLAPLPADAVDQSYTLGAGDVIRVHVFGEPDLSFDSLLVGESGKVAYPFLGEVTIKGLNLAAFEQLLMAGLKPDYLIDPKISISIVQYRPFFIHGQVKSPGGYAYQPGLRLRQAVSLAQGFTERASQSRIFVVHDNDPSAERRRVDLSYNVRPGDTITVEESFF
jgi:polysaccharide biosynthesis/export protein VpsN